MSEYRDYENGVADVLAHIAGDGATVERNVFRRGQSGRRRQIDVLVRGRFPGAGDDPVEVVVDCKLWNSRVDISDIEAFIGFLDDIGADIGLLMTAKGASDGAERRARRERGVRLAVISLEDIRAWTPPGTVRTTYRIPRDRHQEANRILRNQGFRVAEVHGEHQPTEAEVVIEVFRHYGTAHPSGDLQRDHSQRAQAALARAGIEATEVGGGTTIAGGTPAHRWVEITVNGQPTGFKVVATSEGEAIDEFLSAFGNDIPRSALSVIKPDGWPVEGLFGLPSKGSGG